jgi:hypothetical protein
MDVETSAVIESSAIFWLTVNRRHGMQKTEQAAKKDEILVFAVSSPPADYMGPFDERREAVAIKVEDLQQNVSQFLNKIEIVIQQCPENVGGFGLETIEIHAEINGEGQIGLLGTGVNIGAKAGIKFVLSK